MAIGLSLVRLMAGSQWTPVEVHFAHPPPPSFGARSHLPRRGLFSCPTNAFAIEREFVERQVPAADERLYAVLRRYLDGVLEEMPREDVLLASARRVVGELMRDGDPTLTQVARKLQVGSRTLQRRLKEDKWTSRCWSTTRGGGSRSATSGTGSTR